MFGGDTGESIQNDLHVYNVEAKRWRRVDQPSKVAWPAARSAHTANVVQVSALRSAMCGFTSEPPADSLVMIIFGGYGIDEEFLNDLWAYAFETGTWTHLPLWHTSAGVVPSPRCLHTCTEVDGRLLVFGGITGPGEKHLNGEQFILLKPEREMTTVGTDAGGARGGFGSGSGRVKVSGKMAPAAFGGVTTTTAGRGAAAGGTVAKTRVKTKAATKIAGTAAPAPPDQSVVEGEGEEEGSENVVGGATPSPASSTEAGEIGVGGATPSPASSSEALSRSIGDINEETLLGGDGISGGDGWVSGRVEARAEGGKVIHPDGGTLYVKEVLEVIPQAPNPNLRAMFLKLFPLSPKP